MVQSGGAYLSLPPWFSDQEGAINLCRGQALADGVFGKLGDAPEIQFLHELLPMALHGLDAHMEFVSDLGASPAFGDELQHFALSGGQQPKGR